MTTLANADPAGLPRLAQLENLVAQIIDQARAQGASAAEAAVSASVGLSVNVRMGEVEKLTQRRDRGLSVTVFNGQARGSASTADWSQEAIRETVAEALAFARYTAADDCNGLADPQRLATQIPDLALYHPWAIDPDAAIELARRCETAALDRDPRIKNSDGAAVSSGRGISVYGNSHGFCHGYPSSRHSLSCAVIAQDSAAKASAEGMQSDYWYSVARDPTALESPQQVGRRAAERALARLNGRRLGTRTVPVLFAPEMARGLYGHFITAISGGTLYRKASFLRDHVGQQVFNQRVTIEEQPHLPKALGSAPFDGEGVATQTRTLVQNGVLQGYLLDSYSARRLGLATTGNAGGCHNLIIGDSAAVNDQPTLLRQLGTGLLVTQLMGQGINLLTGDYSRGAAGFWVENGEIQYPVEEITIAGNLRKMFLNIQALGSDIDYRGVIRCGSLLLSAMTVAGGKQ